MNYTFRRAAYGLDHRTYMEWQYRATSNQHLQEASTIPTSVGGGVIDDTRFRGTGPTPQKRDWMHVGIVWQDSVNQAIRVCEKARLRDRRLQHIVTLTLFAIKLINSIGLGTSVRADSHY